LDFCKLYSLDGKAAVVTGGFTGLGKQMAEGLLEGGANVAVCARRPRKWLHTYRTLKEVARQNRRKLLGSRCDVSVQSEVERFFERAVDELGSVDILVNAAGVAWVSSPEDMKLTDWNKVIGTNLTGTFLCSQAAGRIMIRNRTGSIINMSSVAGIFGSDPEVLDAISYTSSKAGIIGLTRDLAVKWAKHNIRVNTLAPGWFQTHLTQRVIDRSGDRLSRAIPMRRFGTDTELKGVTVFLASEASSYMTGQLICVDGGLTAGAAT
jgi:gluconate 5-dehydrogenase